MSALAERKAAARKQAMAARAKAHAAGQGRAGDHLIAALAPHAGKVLAGYMPMRSEIDPLGAMAAHQGRLCLPVVLGRDQPLGFREWRAGEALVGGDFGTSVPEGGAWLRPDVLIVPLLAFDRRLYRLGYGGGFYDRSLAALRQSGPVTAIGFAYGAQERADLPLEPTDEPLDLIVTEAGIIGG